MKWKNVRNALRPGVVKDLLITMKILRLGYVKGVRANITKRYVRKRNLNVQIVKHVVI